jgi:hypothetical protein
MAEHGWGRSPQGDWTPGGRGALGRAVAEQFSLQATVGGVRGVVEAVLPMTVFSVVWAFSHDVPRSVLAAVVPAAAFAVWRLVARQPVTQAVSGFLGIALGAGVALVTGRAQDFFVPGIVKNVGLGGLYAVSALIRWPLVGLVLGFTLGEDTHWRRVPARMRAYQLATWVWVAVFAVRALVQGWLYAQGNATALGFVNILLGLPLFGLAVALSWLIVRRVPAVKPPRAHDPAEHPAEGSAEDTTEEPAGERAPR